jgi:tetratricopeptide (TPR) repeat protein
MPPPTALSEAGDLVSKGLALDQKSVRLHSTLGMLRMFQWRWAESERAHRHAMSLEPANAFPHMVYPILCSLLGRHEEAVSHAAKAVELDPLDLMTNYRLVQANYYARRYDEAVQTGRIAVELTPDSPYTFFYLALALAATGLNHEAWIVANQGKQLNDGLALGEGYFGYLAGVLGHTIEARRVVTELTARREKDYSPALPLAWTCLGIGETATALDWLETALVQREPYLGSLMVFPGYDTIRDQARFRRLAHELNFPIE